LCGAYCCCCRPRTHHHHAHHKVFPWPLMDVKEEIKMLEEYKEALTKRLEKIKKEAKP